MKISSLLAVFAFLSLVSPALADPPPPPPGPHAPGGPGGPMEFLSPEARMMLFADIDAATAGMTDEQRHAFVRNRIDSIGSLSDGARKSYAAELQARWNALPPAKQAELKMKMEVRRRKGPPPGGQRGPQP